MTIFGAMRLLSFLLLWACVLATRAQDVIRADTVPPTTQFAHTSKGFTFTTADGNYELQLAGRLQFRFSTPFDTDPLTNSDFSTQEQTTLKINRARLKIGGHAYKPWLKYYFEYELSQGNLLDYRMMVERWPALSFKVGQWKTEYNRERMISSGGQQMVDRSLINRPFTLDRQQGASVYGHLAGRGAANVHYWFSVLTGMGRGARANDDTKLMYVGRVQWNVLGRIVAQSGSDRERTEKPAALIALGGSTNRSPYTRFSQAGGGELEAFPSDSIGRYNVQQAMVETAFKYHGFSWQHESHVKNIEDRFAHTTRILTGSYFQAGLFLNEVLHPVPKELEVALRYAVYEPNRDVPNNLQKEYAVAANWFFAAGHKNKLTMEYAYIVFQQEPGPFVDGARFRVQWDVSF